MEFTTFDADNDKSQWNCAAKSGGGFWWNGSGFGCGRQNINGPYFRNDNGQKMKWYDYYDLVKTQLMVKPAAEN